LAKNATPSARTPACTLQIRRYREATQGDPHPVGFIDIYQSPVTASATPSATIPNNAGPMGLVQPEGLDFDSNDNLYASDYSAVNRFAPPFGTTSIPTATVPRDNEDGYQLLVNSADWVFVTNFSGRGTVDVFKQPFSSTSSPAFTVQVTNDRTIVRGLDFDGSGNLWAVDERGGIWEVRPPFSGSSTATLVLTVPGGYGIAFGP